MGQGSQDGSENSRGSQSDPPPHSVASGSLWPAPEGVWGGVWLHPAVLTPPAPVWVPAGCWGAQGRFAYRLFHDLFTNYSSALRPVEDTDRALNVTLQVTLSQIIDMVSGRARHQHHSQSRTIMTRCGPHSARPHQVLVDQS